MSAPMPPPWEQDRIRSRWLGDPRVLLVALLLQIILQPLARTTDLPLSRLLLTLTVAAAVDMACAERRDLKLGLGLGVPAVVLTWLARLTAGTILTQIAYAFTVALFIFILNRMLRRVIRARIVGSDTIYLSICCYLIIGAAWSYIYFPIEHFAPGSFNGLSSAGPEAVIADLFYFSYVTLTTLGYGEITPATPLARSAAVLEAVTGALFLAVLIAMLMGKYTSQKRNGPQD